MIFQLLPTIVPNPLMCLITLRVACDEGEPCSDVLSPKKGTGGPWAQSSGNSEKMLKKLHCMFSLLLSCGEGPAQGWNGRIPEGFAIPFAAKRGQPSPSSAAVQLKLFLIWKGARQNCPCLGLGCSHRSKLERSVRASWFAILCFPEIPGSQQSWGMIYSFPGEMTLGFTGLVFWKIWWAWLAACCLSELSEGCGFWRKVKLAPVTQTHCRQQMRQLHCEIKEKQILSSPVLCSSLKTQRGWVYF